MLTHPVEAWEHSFKQVYSNLFSLWQKKKSISLLSLFLNKLKLFKGTAQSWGGQWINLFSEGKGQYYSIQHGMRCTLLSFCGGSLHFWWGKTRKDQVWSLECRKNTDLISNWFIAGNSYAVSSEESWLFLLPFPYYSSFLAQSLVGSGQM